MHNQVCKVFLPPCENDTLRWLCVCESLCIGRSNFPWTCAHNQSLAQKVDLHPRRDAPPEELAQVLLGGGRGGGECITFLRRLLQKVAMSSAEVHPATDLLQKLSKASFRALWKGELLEKQLTTYCRYLSCSSMTEVTYCCS